MDEQERRDDCENIAIYYSDKCDKLQQRIKELEAEIVKLRNDYVNVADDLNYHQAIFDGSWPTSVEILERVLAKAKALKG